MKLKPFTYENTSKGFSVSKVFVEIVLFLILAIQLVQEFYENAYFSYLTIALSYSGAVVYFFGSTYKYMASMSKENIYQDMVEIKDFYDTFLGSILIPMIFLFDVDNVIFKSVSIKHLLLFKQIILILAFLSAIFNRYILRMAQKYTQRIYKNNEYKNSPNGMFNFELILALNALNSALNFVLFCIFWYVAISFKWVNSLLGQATGVFAFMLTLCVLIYMGVEDKKHIRLILSITATVIVCIFYVYRIFF